MKKYFILFISCLLYQYSAAQTSGTITDINNHTVSLDSMAGKRMLVMILPLQEDTAVVHQLVRFRSKLGDTVKIIGLVCLSGCNVSVGMITGIYEAAINAGVIISTGTAVAEPATERETVLKWLSDKSANNRQTETAVTGSKYFLSRQGKMYAQLGASASLDARVVENLARTRVPGEH